MSSNSSFEGDSDDKLEGKNNANGIKDGKIQDPEGEWFGSTYISGEKKGGETSLGMELELTLGEEV